MKSEDFDDLTYQKLIQVTLEDLEEIEQIKKRRIVLLAKKLDALGTPKDMISQRISSDLQGKVNPSYVRDCLGKEYKYSRQVRKHSTSQSRESASADDSKKVLVGVTNNGRQETAKELPTSAPKEIAKASATSAQEDKQITVRSLQNKIKILEQEKKHVSDELSEKSRELDDLFEEMKQLKQIESERIKYNDFNSAESLLTDGRELLRVKALDKQINERDRLLAKNRFEANLELKERIVPVIILIDRLKETAKVTVDTTKM